MLKCSSLLLLLRTLSGLGLGPAWSREGWDCKELPFKLGEHKGPDETGTETVPSAWQSAFVTAPGAQSAPAAPPLCLSPVFPENKWNFTLQKFASK